MKKILILSEQKSFFKRPVSHDAVLGQEREFLEHGKDNVDIKYKSLMLKIINRVFDKIGIKPVCDSFTGRKYENTVVLYIAMHLNYLKNSIHLIRNLQRHGNKIAIYVWDCWEPEFEDWKEVLDDLKVDYLFFSFKQTYEYFKDIYKCYWVPQSANRYYFKSLSLDKTRLFMQMGRVNDILHEKILNYLKKHNIEDIQENYVYRRDKNTLLFPDLSELVKEINKTKYMVCIPKYYENPKRTGNVCAMTGRYYETIACKTLIIGKKPLIFDELFPADGMIEFDDDYSDFEEKIKMIEADENMYNRIVEDNYRCFMEKHTWSHRLDEMMRIINMD